MNLIDNILILHDELSCHLYRHGDYKRFNISDPKPRVIHKSSVRDRLLHRAIYRKLYPFFDKAFSASSFSCRKNKGTHKALNQFRSFAFRVSKNNTKTCWVLQCDIRKFFDSIDHEILLKILALYAPDKSTLWPLSQVIKSFHIKPQRGLPLGNLTSQLLVNIYLNELDLFVKHRLKAKYYVRYADDFVIISDSRQYLNGLLPRIREFLAQELKLALNEHKVFIKTYASGIDFLGWVHFPYHRQIRTTTKRRMIKRLQGHPKRETKISYRGLLSHGNTYKLRKRLGLVDHL
jgi:retron-type reverse transcriptase